MNIHSQHAYVSMTGKFEIRRTTQGNKYFFILKCPAGSSLLVGGCYRSKNGVHKGIAAVRGNAVQGGRFRRSVQLTGHTCYELRAGNGEIIGRSPILDSADEMESGIAAVKLAAPVAQVVDLTAADESQLSPEIENDHGD
jgi:hypothetical protein